MEKHLSEYYKELESKLQHIDKIDYRDTLTSTQTIAKQLFHLNKGNFLIVAREQTESVGRFKREWKSPADGGFYGSFVFREGVDKEKLPSFNLFISLALAEVFKYYTDDIIIKWPNDLLLNGKKISGILTEIYTDNEDKAIILGIGININRTRCTLLETATTLEDITESKISIPLFLSRLLVKIEKYYTLYLNESFSVVRDKYITYFNALGREFRITTNNEQFLGTAVDIDEKGFLKVFDESGKIRTIMSADIEM